MYLDATILFQIAGIGIITALIHTVLKQVGKEDIAQFVSLVGFIIVLVIVIHHLADLFQQIRSVFYYKVNRMDIIQLVLVGMIASIIYIILKDIQPTFAFLILLLTSFIIISVVITQINAMIQLLQ